MKVVRVTSWIIAWLAGVVLVSGCGVLSRGDDNSPDIPGKIVFSAKDDEGTSQIFTMQANGTDVKQLTHFGPEGGAIDPAWSPDGTRIAFANFTDATTLGPYLYLMDADGGNMRPLKRMQRESPKALIGSAPAWSSDGTKIAYQVCTNCERGGEDYEIVVVDVAGQTYDPNQVHAVTDHPASDMNPTWSPDGNRIAFVSDRDHVDADTMRYRTDLYIVNADGSNLSRLTNTGNATRPAWNPDGKTIAYEWNRQGNNVFLVDISTSTIMTVNPGLQFSGYPMWNLDGNKLLVSGRETEKAKPEMRLLDMRNNSTDIVQKIALDKKAVGRDYDWYISSKN